MNTLGPSLSLHSWTLPSFSSTHGSFFTQMAFEAPVLWVLKSLPCLGLSSWLRLWVKNSPWLDSPSLFLSLSLTLCALSLSFSPTPSHSPSLSHLTLSVSLPLSSPSLVSFSGLVLTSWSCSLPGACTTPQTRVETGSSRSQSKAWKNEGGRWEGRVGDEAALCVHIRVCVWVCVAGSLGAPLTTSAL